MTAVRTPSRVAAAALLLAVLGAVTGCGRAQVPHASAPVPASSVGPTAEGAPAVAGAPAADGSPTVAAPTSLVLVTARPTHTDAATAAAVDAVRGVANDLGAHLQLLQSTSPDALPETMARALALSPDLVVGVSDEVLTAFDATAAANLDQQFLLVDATPPEPTDNLTAVGFREHETTYLAGVEAAVLSRTGVVGVVAPQDDIWGNGWTAPFADGVRSVGGRGAVVRTGYASSAADLSAVGPRAGIARRAARAAGRLTTASPGADVVASVALGRAGDLSDDVARGALGRSGALVLTTSYGPSSRSCTAAPGRIADDVVRHLDVVTRLGIAEVLAGRTGTTTAYGLAEGALSLASMDGQSACAATGDREAVGALARARAQIVSGAAVVADPDVVS